MGSFTKTFGFIVRGALLNQAPEDIALSASSIAENNSVGDVIGVFSTTDPDTGDTFTYSFAEGEGDTDNASFLIDGANLKAGIEFDYEARSSYSIRVRSTDQGGLYFEKVFAITITDVEEVPENAVTTFDGLDYVKTFDELEYITTT